MIFKSVVLPEPFGPKMPMRVVAQYGIGEIADYRFIVHRIAHIFQFNDGASEARGRHADFHFAALDIDFLVFDFFKALDTGALFGGASLCAASYPFQFIAQEVLAFLLGSFLPFQPLIF